MHIKKKEPPAGLEPRCQSAIKFDSVLLYPCMADYVNLPSHIPYQGSSPYSEECERRMAILEYPHCHTRYVLHILQVLLGST